MVRSWSWIALTLLTLSGSVAQGAHKWGLKEGTPDLKSAGQLAFGPDGVLFVGDTKGGAVFAIDTADMSPASAKPAYNIEKLDDALSAANSGAKVTINDMAVNPVSGNIYLSVNAGETPGLMRIDTSGKSSQVSLAKVSFQKAQLSGVPEDKATGEGPRARNRRSEAITDLAYVGGRLLIAGLTNDASPSSVRELSFPFSDYDRGTSVEIYHAAHGRSEDSAAIKTFTPMTIGGKPTLLAGYTCTPLVRFDLDTLKSSKKTKGTTVAELGNRNTPIDMIAYEQGGQQYLLVANTARGVMKVSTKDIDREEGLTKPVQGGGTAGQTFEQIKDLEGTVQLDRLNDTLAVVIINKDKLNSLRSVPLP